MALNKNKDPLTHRHGIVGRPEFKDTSKGTVLSFGLGMKQSYDDDAPLNWLNCTVWNTDLQDALADIDKGDHIAVTGFVSTREYDGKTYTTLSVTQVGIVEMVKRGKASPNGTAAAAPAAPELADGLDDIGF